MLSAPNISGTSVTHEYVLEKDLMTRGLLVNDVLTAEEAHASRVVVPQLRKHLLVRAVLAPKREEQHTSGVGMMRERNKQRPRLRMVRARLRAAKRVREVADAPSEPPTRSCAPSHIARATSFTQPTVGMIHNSLCVATEPSSRARKHPTPGTSTSEPAASGRSATTTLSPGLI